jgi:uncharacterized protein (DUF362 family)
MATISIRKATYSEPEIDRILEPLGGMERFVEKGDKVLLKVNLLSGREPEKAVTTHPALVKAVAAAVKQAGGRPYIGDSPAGTFSKRVLKKAYTRSGLEEMAGAEDIPLNFDTGTRTHNIPSGRRLKQFPACRYTLDADKIISLPKLKTHSMQFLTLACKNMFGAVPGLTKAAYHARFPTRAAFADMLLDILMSVEPVLVIMDGITGMQGQGPGNGDPVNLGWILASTDAVAMDIAVCRAIGVEPVRIPVLKQAKIRGMWPVRIDYPHLNPEDIAFEGFKLTNTADHLRTGKKMSAKRPVVTDRCTGCGECERICPKEAVKVNAGIAVVDYPMCIRCFCCHEVCPEDAIRLDKVKIQA